MGLKLKPIAFGGLALAAVLLPLRRPPSRGDAAPSADPRALRLDSLSWQYRVAQYSWSAFELRDSAASISRQTRAAIQRPAIIYRGFNSPPAATQADSILTEWWARLGTTKSTVHTSALVYNEDAYRHAGYVGAFIRQDGDRTECVAIAPAWMHQKVTSVYGLRDALAPCALLSAFGRPGAGVLAWLDATRYAAARSDRWLLPDTATAPFGGGPWIEWMNADENQAVPDDFAPFLRPIGAPSFARILRPVYEYGATGLRCLAGDPDACARGVLHPTVVLPAGTTVPPELTLSAWWIARPTTVTLATVRPPSATLVSAMIAEFGRDRFQRFWSSDQPFEAAFQATFGESLGAWTRRWAHRQWLETFEAKQLNADILLGVTLRASWLLSAVAWTVIALVVAAWVARRRTA